MGGIKNKKTVSGLFMRHILFMGIETILILGFMLLVLNILFSTKAAYPADYQETFLNKLEEEAVQGKEIESRLESMYRYALFDKEGIYKTGNLKQEKAEEVYQSFHKNGRFYKDEYIKIISSNKGDYYVLYNIKMGFYNPMIEKTLPSPDMVLVIFFILLFSLNLWRIARKFGRIISKELTQLKGITECIEEEDLEFEVPSSSLREIDEVFHSVEKLKDSLSKSLQEQWCLETNRREQIDALGHDLKTPLTIIRGNTELLCECNLDEEENNLVSHIEKNTVLMQKYIQKLLEINRSESGFVIQKKLIEFADFINEIIDHSICLGKSKEIKFTYEMQTVPDKVLVDEEILKRIILNIVDNAVEYSPKNGVIFMEVFFEAKNLKINVEDSGRGFTEDDIKFARKQFYRNDESRNAKEHMGMGLYFVDIMVKKLGGEVRLSNSVEFGGAKVEIELYNCSS